MTNETYIQEELNAYFQYIKNVYLGLYEKYLNEETKTKIKQITDIIEVDLESEFKIKLRDKIIFCMNVDKFIKNNNFENESFNDIDEKGLKLINYYIENKNNPLKIAKEHLLENVVLFFLGNPENDVISLGISNIISNEIAKKYNLISLNFNSKESKVTSKLIEILGEKKVFTSLLNGDKENLINLYNKYLPEFNDENFETLNKKLNNEYKNYGNNKNKVFLADSIYYYQKINYSDYLKQMDIVLSNKNKKLQVMKDRIDSILECMTELNRYKFGYTKEEQVDLYYAESDLKRIITKIENDGKIDKYFDDILLLEEKLIPLVSKVWSFYINSQISDNENLTWLLVQNFDNGYKDDKEKYVITNLITPEYLLMSSDDNRYQYGFIYQIRNNAVIATSPDKILYHIENNQVELEEQRTSLLMTPRNLLKQTLKKSSKHNEVLINKEKSKIVGVYAITDGKEDNISYRKALDLSEKFDLPIIELNKQTKEKIVA